MKRDKSQEILDVTIVNGGFPAGAAPPSREYVQRNNGAGLAGSALENLDKPANPLSPLELAYEEYNRLREEGSVDPNEYCRRYPALQSSLKKLIECHLFLEERSACARAEKAAVPWPERGQTFLGFHLFQELGTGSLARVFLATEPLLGHRLVAVKISLLGGRAEAEILGRIKHPNIVPVHSVQTDRATGLTVVCMPYLGRATLCDVLDRVFAQAGPPVRGRVILEAVQDVREPADLPGSRTPPAPLLEQGTYLDGIRHLGAQLADALAFIHERGICHRDLKPSNILMAPDGTPMLLDFNLSAAVTEAPTELGGTLSYMSPEQLLATDEQMAADPSLLDARSDIFSLGVILYQLLTGQHPFGTVPLNYSLEELRKHLLERERHGPVPVRKVHPGVDKPLRRLVESCLCYNPKDRPQSAGELAAAFRNDLRPLRRARRWIGRHPRTVLAILLVALATSLWGAYSWSLQAPYSERRYHKGVELYQQGHFSQAVRHFSLALEADSTRTEALFARGRAYQKLGEEEPRFFNFALADFHEANKEAPAGKTNACIGYCFNRLGQPQPAISFYLSAIKTGFAPAEVYNNLGYSYLRSGQVDSARQSLDQALVLDPGLQPAFYNRALVWLHKAHGMAAGRPKDHDKVLFQREKMSFLEKGIADIRRAIELGPGTAKLYHDAAHLYVLGVGENELWIQPALDYLELAVNHGHDPKQLAGDSIFTPLRNEKRFGTLLMKSSPALPPKRLERLLDPLDKCPK